MTKNKSHKVLFAPLDWGLGHATRMTPLIQEFLNLGCEVEIATGGQAYELLMHEFPKLQMHRISGFDIRYSKHPLLMFRLIAQAPAMFRGMRKEYKWLKAYCENKAPDLIISDNRFGMHNKSVPSVYVTHQINVIMPNYLKGLQPLVRYIHKKIIKNYQLCLIPDMEQQGLTGILAHSMNHFDFPHHYVGVLSRFPRSYDEIPDEIPDVLAVISGPEPQRTILETKLVKRFKNETKSVLIVSGKPDSAVQNQVGSVKIISHLPSETLSELMKAAPVLICRSGYSTLMDLFEMGRKAIIIPTPGQTEQEYLANYFMDHYNFKAISQNAFSENVQLEPEHCGKWSHPAMSSSKDRLKQLVLNLLQIKKG
ncbi:MAG: glycosyltransferase [Bacteroidota bacterium]|nr:glycosyltransferase [Bacteroidota bacterium]